MPLIKIEEGARRLRSGEVVAFPTETVFGLGADATCSDAVARIFKLKGRPSDNPLIVHFSNIKDIEEYAILGGISIEAQIQSHLSSKFWPGPLTLVLPLREERRHNNLSISQRSLKNSINLATPAMCFTKHLRWREAFCGWEEQFKERDEIDKETIRKQQKSLEHLKKVIKTMKNDIKDSKRHARRLTLAHDKYIEMLSGDQGSVSSDEEKMLSG